MTLDTAIHRRYGSIMTLKEARTLCGMSQTDLEQRADLPTTTISRLESGRIIRPRHDTVTRIVKAFHGSGLKGITAEQLFPIAAVREAVSHD